MIQLSPELVFKIFPHKMSSVWMCNANTFEYLIIFETTDSILEISVLDEDMKGSWGNNFETVKEAPDRSLIAKNWRKMISAE
eukprot:snap_masked-scaffold_11-processed-gene-1.18-mRNA-1 protein AED:1.00 eAED:1.00 QI:0/-1/0/0/-1/1/1/0/81